MALIKNKCTLWILIGGCLRFWQGMSLSYFCPRFFNLYGKENLYATMAAVSVLVGGFSSNMIAGFISDKYDNRWYKTKPTIAVVMSLIAVPIFMLCYLFTFNFYFSMCWYFLEFLLCEGWMSPNIAMIMTVIE